MTRHDRQAGKRDAPPDGSRLCISAEGGISILLAISLLLLLLLLAPLKREPHSDLLLPPLFTRTSESYAPMLINTTYQYHDSTGPCYFAVTTDAVALGRFLGLAPRSTRAD